MSKIYKGGFICFVWWKDRSDPKRTMHEKYVDGGIPIPIRNRRELAKYLWRVALRGFKGSKFEVLTWERATEEGRNPWACSTCCPGGYKGHPDNIPDWKMKCALCRSKEKK